MLQLDSKTDIFRQLIRDQPSSRTKDLSSSVNLHRIENRLRAKLHDHLLKQVTFLESHLRSDGSFKNGKGAILLQLSLLMIYMHILMFRCTLRYRYDQKSFLLNTCSFCYWYSARVIHMFLNEGKLAKILPPYQHIMSRFAGASTRVLTSFGRPRLSSLMKRSGNPSRSVFPPERTISL